MQSVASNKFTYYTIRMRHPVTAENFQLRQETKARQKKLSIIYSERIKLITSCAVD